MAKFKTLTGSAVKGLRSHSLRLRPYSMLRATAADGGMLMQAMKQRHEAFEGDLATHQERVEQIAAIVHELKSVACTRRHRSTDLRCSNQIKLNLFFSIRKQQHTI